MIRMGMSTSQKGLNLNSATAGWMGHKVARNNYVGEHVHIKAVILFFHVSTH